MKHHVLRWVAVFAALICFGIAAFFMWQVYQQEKEYKEGDDIYALIEQMAAQSSTENGRVKKRKVFSHALFILGKAWPFQLKLSIIPLTP